ncbi:MAG: hypothetical protein CL445_08660 [Acidimicrobiaceae bacterium]|nr:hypothetical protein [Acidimicrobiaceae bacterium]
MKHAHRENLTTGFSKAGDHALYSLIPAEVTPTWRSVKISTGIGGTIPSPNFSFDTAHSAFPNTGFIESAPRLPESVKASST